MERGSTTKILRADHRPAESNRRLGINYARHHSHIRLGGCAFLTCIQVHSLYSTTIGGEVGDIILQVQIIFRNSCSHDKITRDGLQGFENHLGRDFYNLPLPVHKGSVIGKNVQAFFRREFHSHVFKDVKRGVLELIQLRIGQELEKEKAETNRRKLERARAELERVGLAAVAPR